MGVLVLVEEGVDVRVDVLVVEGVLVGEGVTVGVRVKVGVGVGVRVGVGKVGVIDGVISAATNVHVGAFVRVGEGCMVGGAVQLAEGRMVAASMVEAEFAVVEVSTGTIPGNPLPERKSPIIKKATKPRAPAAANPMKNKTASSISVMPNKSPWLRLFIFAISSSIRAPDRSTQTTTWHLSTLILTDLLVKVYNIIPEKQNIPSLR